MAWLAGNPKELAMRHQLVLAAALALAACASGGPSSPNRPVSSAAVSPPAEPSPPSYGLRVAALPTRSAGAAFATAGEEHALVRQGQTLPAATSPALRQAARSPGKEVSIVAGLPARVLEVHAAYRRWCAGASLPEDDVLLASAGGLRLAGAVACERSRASSRPTRLVPDPD